MSHTPTRTCIVTRQKRPLSELIRLFEQNGKVYVQKDSMRTGRGVYLLPDLEVFDKAFKSKRNPVKYGLKLERSLTKEEIESLRKEFEEVVRK